MASSIKTVCKSLVLFFGFALFAAPAFAEQSFSAIGDNVAASMTNLPGVLAAVSYAIGILLGALGVIKLKNHVETPTQNPLKDGLIRLLAGGALFALPMIYEAMFNTVGSGEATQAAVLKAVDAGTIDLAASGSSVSDIGHNIVDSLSDLPGLIAAISYMLGLLFGALGIIKLKDHVENPTQTPLRTSVIRFLIGGGLFALPIIQEAAINTIGTDSFDIDNTDIFGSMTKILANITSLGGLVPDINTVLLNILKSLSDLPSVITAIAYLIGVLLIPLGLLKIKEHVENPEQNPMKDGVVRLLTAGALFGLPSVYNAMFHTIGGDGLGVVGNIGSFISGLGGFVSQYDSATNGCSPLSGLLGTLRAFKKWLGYSDSSETMGQVVCVFMSHVGFFPAFLSAIAYLIGLILGLWGIFKLKNHVQDPRQTALWEGLSRLFAGGAFFALPVVIATARETLSPTFGSTTAGSFLDLLKGFLGGTPFNESPGSALGLDGMLTHFMVDLMAPLHVMLNFFAFCAGMIFIMIGISRLIKSAQDGHRGPGGLGTIMTFFTGAALISYNQLVAGVTTSFFSSPATATFAQMQYTDGMSADELASAHTVISAILRFVLIIGLFSFVRGIFIIRGAAEGSQQASVMSGLTHIIAGTLCVNVGSLLNVIQATLGIGGFGIAFS